MIGLIARRSKRGLRFSTLKFLVPGIAIIAVVLAALAFSRPAMAGATPVCGATDIAFVIDDTGSMGAALDSVSNELSGLFDDIVAVSGGDYRLSLVTFKNDVTVRENFADANRAVVGPAIQALFASGGDNTPEASDEALNTVINALPVRTGQNIAFTPAFRPGALKIVILITDAVPGGFDDEYVVGVDDVHAHQLAQQAAAAGIHISAVFVPTGSEEAEPIMRDYASTSGGIFTRTAANGVGSGTALRDLIALCGGAVPSPVVSATRVVPSATPTEVARIKPADLHVGIKQAPEPAIAAGDVFTFSVRVINYGPGSPSFTSVEVPLDPAVEIQDFHSGSTGNYVRSLTTSTLDIRFGDIGINHYAEATVYARVRPDAAAGHAVVNRAYVHWEDNNSHKRVSNSIPWTVGATTNSGYAGLLQSLTVGTTDPVAAGAAVAMSGNFYGGEERVSFWINKPDGTVQAISNYGLTNNNGALAFSLNTSGLAAGTYSLVGHGNATGAEGTGTFTIR